jgi:hypothetical protein
MDLIPASAPHWHLVLNHLPSVGTLVAVCLLAAARVAGSRELTQAGLLLLVVLALVAIPTLITGGAAQTALLEREEISEQAMTAHLDAALIASAALLVTGWVAWFLLWRDRRRPALDGFGPTAVALGGAVSLALMLWTARLGGEINHPEIRTGVAGEDGGGVSTAIVDWVVGNAWAWPALEAIHFVGMALLFGAVLLVTLRVLGLVRRVPFAALHRLLPLGVFGFGMNLATGVAFFLVDTGRYSAMTYGFYPKMALIVVGGVAGLYFTIFESPWALEADDDAPTSARAMATATLLLWCAVIAYGRLLPYLPGA